MTQTKRAISSGVRNNFLGFLNDDGRFIGATPTAPAVGVSSGMREMLGMKSVALTQPDPETTIIDGDDVLLGEFEEESLATRAYIAEMAVWDIDLDNYLMGTTVVSYAGGDWGAFDVKDAPERPVCVLHQGRGKMFDSNNKGRKANNGIYIPVATARPLWRQAMTSREGAVYRLWIVPALGSYGIGGVSFANSHGLPAMVGQTFRSDNPYHVMAFRGNNSLAAIPVDYEPVSAAKTSAWKNQGTALTVSSVSAAGVTPRIATLSAAPATDEWTTVLYQFSRK